MIAESGRHRLGFMFDGHRQPEELAGFAADLEECGADDLWVVEDLGWSGGIAAAGVALAATRRLRVGIGVAPVALRNPALLAMELAMLARVHPGRLVAGVGHGVPEWMRQVGAERKRKLALLEESILVVRGLLAGEKVEFRGSEVTVDGVRLEHPPRVAPPIVTGVVRPRSLELSGRVADGTIIAEGHGPADLVAARRHIDKGRAAGDRPAHEVVTFAFLRVDDDPARAAEVTRGVLAGQAEWLGRPVDQVFALVGPAGTVPARVAALHAAGAGTVVLRPLGPDPAGQARAALAAVALG